MTDDSDDGPCTDCYDTGITFQTERRCACQPTESPRPMTSPTIMQAETLADQICGCANHRRDVALLNEAFAAHRQAALLEGVRIGLEAAMKAINAKCEHSQNNRGWAYVDVSNLDPATVLARHGGA